MRLEAAPDVGPVLATALVAAVADPKSFRSGRNFSAWIGMVPKQHSSGEADGASGQKRPTVATTKTFMGQILVADLYKKRLLRVH